MGPLRPTGWTSHDALSFTITVGQKQLLNYSGNMDQTVKVPHYSDDFNRIFPVFVVFVCLFRGCYSLAKLNWCCLQTLPLQGFDKND